MKKPGEEVEEGIGETRSRGLIWYCDKPGEEVEEGIRETRRRGLVL